MSSGAGRAHGWNEAVADSAAAHCARALNVQMTRGGASRALSPKTPTLRNFGDEKPQLHTLLRMRVVYHWERGNAYLRCIRMRKLVTHEDNSDKLDKV